MERLRSDLSEFLCPPRKKQKTENLPASRKFESHVENSNLLIQKEISSKLNQLSKYCPRSKEELVVHKKKIEEVESWLKCYENESPYLLITGPSGCGKLRTLQVLCHALKIDLVEWVSPVGHTFDPDSSNPFYQNDISAFEDFVLRATRYSNVLSNSARRIIVVKDIPNGFVRKCVLFHHFLEKFYDIERIYIVFIFSEFSVWHELFPDNIKNKFNIRNICFNPITQRNISTALQNVVKRFDLSKTNPALGSHIDQISLECNGDLRNALATLQFFLVKGNLNFKTSVSTKNKSKTKINLKTNSNTVSDNKVDVFHGLGRVLYGKRENGSLVHNPQDVADSFSSCPQLFISMLHENYLNTFSSIHEVAAASASLSSADLLHEGDSYSLATGYRLSVATRGLMTLNSQPIKKFQQFNKGRSIGHHLTLVREYKDSLESHNPFLKGSDILMDVAPFIKHLPHFDSPHKDLICKLGKFPT